MLPRADVVALLTAATVFACPSIYEPLGIVNLEAMACETAVVATATGGIPEVVVDGETGWLVPIEQATDGTGTPLRPRALRRRPRRRPDDAVSDPDRAAYVRRSPAGARAQESFSWAAIADADRWRSTARSLTQASGHESIPEPRPPSATDSASALSARRRACG